MTLDDKLADITLLASDTNINEAEFKKQFGYSWNFYMNFNSVFANKRQVLINANDFWKYIVKLYRTDQKKLKALYTIRQPGDFNTIVNIIIKLLKTDRE